MVNKIRRKYCYALCELLETEADSLLDSKLEGMNHAENARKAKLFLEMRSALLLIEGYVRAHDQVTYCDDSISEGTFLSTPDLMPALSNASVILNLKRARCERLSGNILQAVVLLMQGMEALKSLKSFNNDMNLGDEEISSDLSGVEMKSLQNECVKVCHKLIQLSNLNNL